MLTWLGLCDEDISAGDWCGREMSVWTAESLPETPFVVLDKILHRADQVEKEVIERDKDYKK